MLAQLTNKMYVMATLEDKSVKPLKINVVETNKPNASYLKPMAELLYDHNWPIKQFEA